MNSNKAAIYLIAIGAFALGVASYITAGLIPMIAKDFTVSTSVAAQLVTAFTLGYGLDSPVFVALLPASRQRLGLLLALALFTVANAACALAGDIGLLILFRTVEGIGAGVYVALGVSSAVSLADEGARGKSISFVMGGMSSGTVLGVPLSLLFAERLGWKAALWIITALGLITFIGLLCKLPPLPQAKASTFRSKFSILHDRHVLRILLVSQLAAMASLGMYTFIALFMKSVAPGELPQDFSAIPFLWAWGIGGVLGSYYIGPLVDKMRGMLVSLGIMITLSLALLALPLTAMLTPWACLIPLIIWGAVGWALQVPQNNELLKARQEQGDGNLAVALNVSALYLGSAIGAALGGGALLLGLPLAFLPIVAAGIAAVGAFTQFMIVLSARK